MPNKTLIEIFKTFSQEELTRFGEMLSSPYFNKKESLAAMWDELKKHHPEYKTDKESLYSKIYPGKEYNYGTMKNLIYELTQCAETFIELEFYSKRDFSKSENMLLGLLNRDLDRLFGKRLKKTAEELEGKKQEYNYHQNKYQLETLKQNYLLSKDSYTGRYKASLETFSSLTLAYFIDLFINYYNTALLKREFNEEEYSLDFINEALDYYREVKIEKDFMTEIYYNAFMLAYKDNENNFHALKKLLDENSGKLSAEQKYNFYVALTNFCKMKSYTDKEFSRKQFELYKYMIENKIYSIDIIDKMEGNFYKNAAACAGSVREFDWANNFIEEYKSKLDEKVRDNYFHHALVELCISQNDWKRSAESLAKIKHANSADKLNLKRWQMIIFYETKNYEELRYLIDSSKHFLFTDKSLSEISRENFKIFTETMNRLVMLTETSDAQEKKLKIKDFLSKITDNKLKYKDWFESKAKALT